MSEVWAPTVADISALLPRRPAFTSSSRPSTAQVQSIIDSAAAAVAAELPLGGVATRLYGKAKDVTALRAAARVERAFFPEQAAQVDSDYALIYAEYQSELLGLRNLSSGLAVDAPNGGSLLSVPLTTELTYYPLL